MSIPPRPERCSTVERDATEYFHDIDYIPEDDQWEAREWDPKYALYCWGPDVPRDFIDNKEDPTA